MSAIDHPSLLTRLIIAGELTLQMRHAVDHTMLIDLVDLIVSEGRKPTDRKRVINDEVVMCAQAVLKSAERLRGYSRPQARSFCQVVGVLLPDVRSALEEAIEQRKRPTP